MGYLKDKPDEHHDSVTHKENELSRNHESASPKEAEQEANQERERENQARGRGEVRCMGGCREDPGRISLAVWWTIACAEEGRGRAGRRRRSLLR